MLCITDTSTDPYWNLAAEEYLLDHFSEPIFRLWRNSPAVIVGRNQNALAEIDRDFVERRSVAVVRRLTGGGAVFHDLGNVNYTFIDARRDDESTGEMFRRFTAPIITALRSLGVDASLQGRNDLTINGAKFSGNAICVRGGRVLQHGTLLFSSSVEDISSALKPRAEKYSGRGVASVRSRVTNISSHLPQPMSVEEFIAFLSKQVGGSGTPYTYSAADQAAIDYLADMKYRTPDWNFGQSPAYTFSACRRFAGGTIEAYLDIKGGVIEKADIRGDYFFKAPTSEFCEMLQGCQYTKEKVTGLLSQVTSDDYFCGVSSDELLQLLF